MALTKQTLEILRTGNVSEMPEIWLVHQKFHPALEYEPIIKRLVPFAATMPDESYQQVKFKGVAFKEAIDENPNWLRHIRMVLFPGKRKELSIAVERMAYDFMRPATDEFEIITCDTHFRQTVKIAIVTGFFETKELCLTNAKEWVNLYNYQANKAKDKMNKLHDHLTLFGEAKLKSNARKSDR